MARPLKALPDDAPDLYAFVNTPKAANDETAKPATPKPDMRALVEAARTAKPVRSMPLFYHCRGGESDLSFVQRCICWIPDGQRHAVSVEYERLFLAGGRDGRKNANTFLHGLASSYRSQQL